MKIIRICSSRSLIGTWWMRAAQAVIRAAQDSLAVDRSYRSALATAMARIAESQAA